MMRRIHQINTKHLYSPYKIANQVLEDIKTRLDTYKDCLLDKQDNLDIYTEGIKWNSLEEFLILNVKNAIAQSYKEYGEPRKYEE